MTDIIERLRAAVPTYEGTPIAWPCEVRSELLLEAAAEVERLREVLLHISRYETVGPAGFEWDIVVEELVTIARDALEGKP